MMKYYHQPYIMVVDDDPDDIFILSSSLEDKGVTVKSFQKGEQAIQYLQEDVCHKTMPSLIILDYNMPGNNGQQMLAWIKSNAGTRQIPVVMYSTHLSADFQISLKNMGAYDCLVKPNNYSVFKEQVELFKSMAVDNRAENIHMKEPVQYTC
ncbi:MAG TPA: response regulator [Chitinophagaceae bacterium]